jgi:exodeoxyribonuclease V beta subunit
MNTFDLLNTPLEEVNLIEASAGTGKTYTITGLFLRLILEKNLTVDRILVVTYTEAATAELKERIRSRLLDARDAFRAGGSSDSFIDNLIQKYNEVKDGPDRINDAIRCFDQASIFTIHGFCMRVLHENAFESGSLFDTDLIENQIDLEADTACDFWRKRIHKASAFFIHYLVKKHMYPEALLSSVGNCLYHPDLHIIPDLDKVIDTGVMEKEYYDTLHEVSEEWGLSKNEVVNILLHSGSLNRNKYQKKTIKTLIVEMDKMISPLAGLPVQLNGPPLFIGFQKFTTSMIKESIKKDCVAPQHRFFDLCEMLWALSQVLESAYDKMLMEMKRDVIGFIRAEVTKRKQTENIRSFNDLLIDVHEALTGEKGHLLAEAIRRSYSAALIDEFQDTDPTQYSIFHKVFGRRDSILFLIGDPKQAIYGFRGADIFTYMQAAKRAQNIYTLKENYRSEPEFINAINTIFTNASKPFLYESISFERINSPETIVNQEKLSISGEDKKPFIIWRMNTKVNDYDNETNRLLSKDRTIADAVAGEISRLLYLSGRDQIRIGKRTFTSGDAAVLVRTNREAEIVKDSLNRLGIPGVVYGSGNVFDSREAKELEKVLSGIIRFDKESTLKAAFATEMIGTPADDLFLEKDSYDAIEEHREIFLECRNIWYGQGFMKMLRMLLRKENIMTRLIEFFDGERRITNLLHLAEILQKKSVEARIDAEDLLKWYQRQLDPFAIRKKEEQLRLESDENAVRIITIHKSKGLEFPVVFCPFLLGSSKLRTNAPVLFHDNTDKKMLTLDVGSDRMSISRADAERELLAENLRLVYVALTRAKNRCYMVWGKLKQAETSAPAYLLHQPETPEGDFAHQVRDRYMFLDEDVLSKDLERLSDISFGSISITGLPQKSSNPYKPIYYEPGAFSAREFTGKVDRNWRVASFSSIAHSRYAEDVPDHDGLGNAADLTNSEGMDRSLKENEDVDPIFLFPKGAKAGTCLHEIFENIDFTEPELTHTARVVEEKLVEHGFESEWNGTICNMVTRVLSAPLAKDDNEFTLSRINEKERLHELEFYYPMHSITPRELGRMFIEGSSILDFPEQFSHKIGLLDSKGISGYMKGFIDLVFHYRDRFYIVDWKSNFLGYHQNKYDQASLSKEMAKRLYILQYHIYAVAVHKYLQNRIPHYNYEKHFGGIYYLFLRGISEDAHGDYGIFYDRPDKVLINKLCFYFENKKNE